MSNIDTLELGQGGLFVSRICLGTMYFGTKVDEAPAFGLLDYYYEQGGRFLDTANKYACWIDGFQGGESEELLGRWMKQRGNRNDMFIATKLGFEHPPHVPAGLKSHMIEQECERSLIRLGLDSIDLYYAHCDDRSTPVEETLGTFQTLIQDGKVRCIGASNFMTWRLEESNQVSAQNGWSRYQCIQQAHTYIRSQPGQWNPGRESGPELLDYCRSRKVTLLAYCPLRQGAYTRPDRPIPWPSRDTDARLKVLNEIAVEQQATANQIVLAWMMQSTPPVIPVMTGSNLDQLRENLAAVSIHLTGEDIARLDNAGIIN